eukprot:g33059.t1
MSTNIDWRAGVILAVVATFGCSDAVSGREPETRSETKPAAQKPTEKPNAKKPGAGKPGAAARLPVLARSQVVLEWQLDFADVYLLTRLNGAWKSADGKTIKLLEAIVTKNDRITNAIMRRNAYRAATRRPGFESFQKYVRQSARAKLQIDEIRKQLKKQPAGKKRPAFDQEEVAVAMANRILKIAASKRVTKQAFDEARRLIAADGRLDLLGITVWTDTARPGHGESLTNAFSFIVGKDRKPEYRKRSGLNLLDGEASDTLRNSADDTADGSPFMRGGDDARFTIHEYDWTQLMFHPSPVLSHRDRALRTAACLLALGCVFSQKTAHAAEPRYRLVELGSLGGTDTQPYDVNEKGWVVGFSKDAGGSKKAFLWKNGKMEALDGVHAWSLNDKGTVVGLAHRGVNIVGRSEKSPFLLEPGKPIRFNLLPRIRIGLTPKKVTGFAVAVNNKGNVLMNAYAAFAYRAYLWDGTAVRDLGDLGGRVSIPYDLNDNNVAVGWSKRSRTSIRAFMWKGGRIHDLGTLASDSGANAVNNKDEVVGIYRTWGGSFRSFVWKKGKMTALETLGGRQTTARDINDNSVIVGHSDLKAGGRHGVVWKNGTIEDLNTLLPEATRNAGWEIVEAFAINNRGQIAAVAKRRGITHAVLLNPADIKPENNPKADAAPVARVEETKPRDTAKKNEPSPKQSSPKPEPLKSNSALPPVDAKVTTPSVLRETSAETPGVYVTSFGAPPEGWKPVDVFARASYDFTRLAYTAEKSRGARRAVIDGVPGPEFLIVNDILFSPDSRRVMYQAHRRKGGRLLVLDGRETRLEGTVMGGSMLFAPNSKSILYVATTGEIKRVRGRLEAPGFVVLDGKRGPTFGYMCRARISPDSKRYAHAAVLNGTPVVVVDGKLHGRYDNLPGFPFTDAPIFSPDSKRVAYVVKNRRGQSIAVIDNRQENPCEKIHGVRFSPDSSHVAYVVKQAGRYSVVTDGTVSTLKYDNIYRPLVYSPDSKHLAYVATIDKQMCVVKDGVPGKRYQRVSSPVFSPDNKHFAFWATENDKTFVVRDGRRGPDLDGLVSRIYFSPDSKRIAYVGKKGKRHVLVVDDKPGPEFDKIESMSLTFSPDSRHFACWVQKGKEWSILLDGERAPGSYTSVVRARQQRFDIHNFYEPSLHFVGNSRLRAIARRDGGDYVQIAIVVGNDWKENVVQRKLPPIAERADAAAIVRPTPLPQPKDPLVAGAVLSGLCAQRFRRPYPMELRISKRNGNAFEGTTYYRTLGPGEARVRGTIVGGKVTFTEYSRIRGRLAAAGVCIALPVLESIPRVHAAGKKAHAPRRMVCVGNEFGMYPGHFWPKTTGRNYELTPLLKPLGPHRDDFTLFSHLDHGLKGGHFAVHTFLTGVKSVEAKSMPEGGISVDQRAAEFVGSQTRFPSLTIGSANGLHGGCMMSWTRTGTRIPPIAGPRELFRALFVDETAAAKQQATDRIKLRGSILDAVLGDARSLRKRVSKTDGQKLDEYLSAVRDVESKLQLDQKWQKVPKPKTSMTEPRNLGLARDLPAIYDLMALALQTDSTRVITLEIGGSFVASDLGIRRGYHSLSHHGHVKESLDLLMQLELYQTQQFSRFLTKLKSIREPNSNGTLLDNTIALMGSGMGNGNSHTNTNLPIVLAGGGFRHGEYKQYPKDNRKKHQHGNADRVGDRRMMSRAGRFQGRLPRGLVFVALLTFCGVAHSPPRVQAGDRANDKASAATFQKTVKPFLNTYCAKCHGPKLQKAERRFDKLTGSIPNTSALVDYQDILDQLNLGEMPPKKAPQPSNAAKKRVIAWFTARVAKFHAENNPAGGKAVLRRLNSREYRNTIGDLLRLNMTMFDPTEAFPRDQTADHLDNVGESLVTSGYLLQQYLAAADKAVQKAMHPLEKPRVQTWVFRDRFRQQPEIDQVHRRTNKFSHITLYDVIGADKHEGAYGPILTFKQGVPHDGTYEIRFKAEAVNRRHPYDPEFLGTDPSEPLRLGIVAGNAKAGPLHKPQPIEPLLAELDLADEAKWYTVRVRLDAGFTPRFTFRNGLMDVRNLWAKLLRKYPEIPKPARRGIVGNRFNAIKFGKLPQIHIHEVEIKGPFYESWPTAAQRTLLGDDWKQAVKSGTLSEAQMRKHLTRFATRAYRRPARSEEIDRLMKLIAVRRRAGHTPLEAYGDALKAVLCSPGFLYLEQSSSNELSQHALAARLSYFLWSSMPDAPLMKLANENKLAQPAVLKQQVERMLRDPRSEAFIDGFLDSWLTLRDLGSMPPDRRKFTPYYHYDLKNAMREETRRFTRHLIEQNLSVVHFLDSDFTFVNKPLARLYGIKPPAKPGFHKVKLTDRRRGGLLGQASILTVTANGIDTSPVNRGVWVLTNLLATPPNPPPDDVEPLDPDVRGAKTIRDRLRKHRSVATCYDCHRKIDPIGFALENFDPIGRWRTKYNRRAPIDAAGEMPDGTAFQDVREFKRLLLKRSPQFTRSLAAKLLAYGTGRRKSPLDRPTIDRIIAATAQSNHGFRDLITAVATSRRFREK